MIFVVNHTDHQFNYPVSLASFSLTTTQFFDVPTPIKNRAREGYML